MDPYRIEDGVYVDEDEPTWAEQGFGIVELTPEGEVYTDAVE